MLRGLPVMRPLSFLVFLFLLPAAAGLSIDWQTGYGAGKLIGADYNISFILVLFPEFVLLDLEPPQLASYYPVADSTVNYMPVVFYFELEDNRQPKGAWYGLYLNGFLDHNGFADCNADGFAVVEYSSLVVTGDSAYIVVNTLSDYADNNAAVVQATGIYTYQRPPHVFDPGSILTEEMKDVLLYFVYTIFASVGMFIIPILMVVLGLIVFYVAIKQGIANRG